MQLRSSFSAAFVMIGALIPQVLIAQEANASHAHIRHALEAFTSTPDGAGLLPTAESEAMIAQRHAGLAANDPTDIGPMQQHTRHVLNAIDPERFPEGPGGGFGVKAAADGIARHIELAAASEGASANVRTHAAHVVAAAQAVSQRADEIVALGEQILAAGDYLRASRLVGQMQALCEGLVTGVDSARDGTISLDEGGLQHVRQHLALMADAEGLM